MEQKRCKECGEWFTPKSMRQQYCTKLHYRPCPICGKPVEAKYLSDPPRCCSKECQQAARKETKVVQKAETVKAVEKNEEITISTKAANRTAEQWIASRLFNSASKSLKNIDLTEYEDKIRDKFEVMTYIQRPLIHFETGHEYALVISKPKGYHTYDVTAVYDFDTNSIIDTTMPLSSQISINQHFSK